MCVALVLVGVKVWAWSATGSISMLSSAADALVDVVASVVTFTGVRYAAQPADREHRYGHGKGEAVAAFVQAILLAGAALGLGAQSIVRLVTPVELEALSLGIWVVIGSTVTAAALVAVQTYVVKRTRSTAIAADRAHYMTDIAVNFGVLAALALDHVFGWTRSDSIGALLISAYMLWNARDMANESLAQLLDSELTDETREKIRATVLDCDRVQGMHDLRTRYGGDRVFVDFHVEVDGTLSVHDGHAVCDAVEQAVAELFPKADVTAHLEPTGLDDERLDEQVARNDRPAKPH
ncbi:cation transporter [Pararobbsia silviterrae]|uniref:Cation transporter n=2 Tax=Pararobbsia silviterrae TaxID=1792498 RepID=A0A494Y9U8_9BURK|nr:cation transporter [Pararobbsia silviterrae]